MLRRISRLQPALHWTRLWAWSRNVLLPIPTLPQAEHAPPVVFERGTNLNDRWFPAAAAICIYILCSVTASAAPPPGSDQGSPLAAWYHSLTVPPAMGFDDTALCCSVADCRNVQAEIRSDGHWWAYVDSKTFPNNPDDEYEGAAPNAWVEVPDEAVLKRHDNPSGEAVLCWYGGQVRCFVPSAGT